MQEPTNAACPYPVAVKCYLVRTGPSVNWRCVIKEKGDFRKADH